MSGLSKNKLSEMSEVDILNSEKFGLWEVLLFSRLNQNLHLLNNDWEWMCGIKKILWHTNGAQLISVLKGVIVLFVCEYGLIEFSNSQKKSHQITNGEVSHWSTPNEIMMCSIHYYPVTLQSEEIMPSCTSNVEASLKCIKSDCFKIRRYSLHTEI